jgi:hypothetical protein
MDVIRRGGMEVKEFEGFNKFAEPLLNETVEDVQGFYVQSQQMSLQDWAGIIFLGVMLILSIASFFIGQILQGALLVVADTLLAASALPEIIRRKRA